MKKLRTDSFVALLFAIVSITLSFYHHRSDGGLLQLLSLCAIPGLLLVWFPELISPMWFAAHNDPPEDEDLFPESLAKAIGWALLLASLLPSIFWIVNLLPLRK